MNFVDPSKRNQAQENAKALAPLLKPGTWIKIGTIAGVISAVAAIIAAIYTILMFYR